MTQKLQHHQPQPKAQPKQPPPTKCTRLTIPEVIKEQICSFVLNASSPVSGKDIQSWAKLQFGYNFPQSTISTLLSSRGITIKRSGCRGRPPIVNKCSMNLVHAESQRRRKSSSNISINGNTNINLTNSNNNINQLHYSPTQSINAVSKKTGLLLCDLQRLADFRLRSSSSEYPEVEVAILEDTYNLLRLGEIHISCSWLFNQALLLFQANCSNRINHNSSATATSSTTTPSTKYISQFLNQLYNKYYLTNIIAEHLISHTLTYEEMLLKLSTKFSALRFAPIPYTIKKEDQDQDQDGNDTSANNNDTICNKQPFLAINQSSLLQQQQLQQQLQQQQQLPTNYSSTANSSSLSVQDQLFHIPVSSFDRPYYMNFSEIPQQQPQQQPPQQPTQEFDPNQHFIEYWPESSNYFQTHLSSSSSSSSSLNDLPLNLSPPLIPKQSDPKQSSNLVHLPPTPPPVSFHNQSTPPHLLLQASIYSTDFNLNF